MFLMTQDQAHMIVITHYSFTIVKPSETGGRYLIVAVNVNKLDQPIIVGNFFTEKFALNVLLHIASTAALIDETVYQVPTEPEPSLLL